MSLVIANQLTKQYAEYKGEHATKAINGIDLMVEEGEFIAIMGPSGSGKSTLVSILSGILTPTSGTVSIKGQRIDTLSSNELALFRRRKLGFVFQEFNLLDNLTVQENIMLPLVLDKVEQVVMKQRAERIMKQLGIDEIANKYPYQISGGQQQRVAVSRAVINEPYLIFADEPTGNLDSKSANTVMHCLEEMNQKNKVTALMVTHDVFAASFCRKVIFIKDGKINMEIVRKGTRKEFFDHILDCQAVVGGVANEI